MALFDKVKEVGLKGLDKAQDLGNQAKIKIAQEKAEFKVKDLYTEVGKTLVEKFPEFFTENFAEQAAALGELQAELAKLADEMAAAKEKA